MRKSDTIDNRLKSDIEKYKNTELKVPITVNDIKNPMKYQPSAPLKPSIHIGQRKLFNNEFVFLTSVLKTHDQHAIVVYAGASPCNHIWMLHELFPNVKFVLVDPNEFIIHTGPKKNGHQTTQYDNNPQNTILYLYAGKKQSNIKGDIAMLDCVCVQDRKSLDCDKIVQCNKIKNPKTVARINNKNMAMTSLVESVQNSTSRIFIIEDFMTDDLARKLLFKDALFISDIRTNVSDMTDTIKKLNKDVPKIETLKFPGDFDLLWNLAQQFNWINILDPLSSMFKFRAPFMNDSDKKMLMKLSNLEPFASDFACAEKYGLNLLKTYISGNFSYLDGTDYLQPWAGSNSSETRLVSPRGSKIVKYDIAKYEDSMFQWNYERAHYYFKNPFALKTWGFDHCGDCALEAHNMQLYMDKYKIVLDLNKWLMDMKNATGGRQLIIHGHGDLFAWPTWDVVLKKRSESKYSTNN